MYFFVGLRVSSWGVLSFWLTEVREVLRFSASQNGRHIAGNSSHNATLRFLGLRAHVWQQNHVGHFVEYARHTGFLLAYIQRCPGNSLFTQSAEQRIFIHHATARGVDEISARLHAAKLFVAKHPARLFVLRQMERDEIGA